MRDDNWEDLTLYNAFYEGGDPAFMVFGAAASGGMYLMHKGAPYLIRINALNINKPNIHLKTGFYHGKVLLDGDEHYSAIAGAFKHGLHLYLKKVFSIGNQALLPDPLKNYLLENLEHILKQ
jgi:hypothetical protein